MVKIGYPRDFTELRKLFPEKEKEKNLYVMAKDVEKNEVLGVIRFMYHENQVDVLEIVMMKEGKEGLAVFDGIVRTLLFKMDTEECNRLVVHNPQGDYKKYFEGHELQCVDENLVHDNFAKEFFKPCVGCSGK
jgi:hypothetical protein